MTGSYEVDSSQRKTSNEDFHELKFVHFHFEIIPELLSSPIPLEYIEEVREI